MIADSGNQSTFQSKLPLIETNNSISILTAPHLVLSPYQNQKQRLSTLEVIKSIWEVPIQDVRNLWNDVTNTESKSIKKI